MDTAKSDVQVSVCRCSSCRQNFCDAWNFTFDAGQNVYIEFVALWIARKTIDLKSEVTDVAAKLFYAFDRQLPPFAKMTRSNGAGARSR